MCVRLQDSDDGSEPLDQVSVEAAVPSEVCDFSSIYFIEKAVFLCASVVRFMFFEE